MKTPPMNFFLTAMGAVLVIATASLLQPANAQTGTIGPDTLLVGIGATTGSGNTEVEGLGTAIGDLLIVNILNLIDGDSRFKGCDIALIEWRRRDDVLKEYELLKSASDDPNASTIIDQPLLEPTSLIEGTLNLMNNMVTWKFALIDRASTTALATSIGALPASQIWEIPQKVAQDMLTVDPCQGSVRTQ
jgi:hypothetical protein